MNTYLGLDNYSNKTETGIGLGNFDGLHIGHMSLLNTLISECKMNGYESIIYTFYKHPEHILRKKLYTPLIMSIEQKQKVLSSTSLDKLVLEEFDEEFSRLSAEEFVKQILVDQLNAKLVVVGFNYRFGYKGEGDINKLKELGVKYAFKVRVIPPVKVENNIVSSTLIRKLILSGNVNKAYELLGRHFHITGSIGKGKQIGGKMGFPTANIIPKEHMLIPAPGVYITKTLLEDVCYNSITNVGCCPTIDDTKRLVIETHILDFYDDVYGKNIEVYFIERIRKEIKFNSKKELVLQIDRDKQKAKEYFILN